jgi:DNA-binding MarR family transcriptional regulator
MFLLRELPDQECMQRLVTRYPDMEPEALRTIMGLLRTAADVTQGFETFLSKHGLSHGRFAIMMFLNRSPETPVNQTQLAEAYGVAKATITGLIDGLERDTLVERLPDPTDRRASLVRLTPGGQAFLEGFLPNHFRGVAELMSGLDSYDRAEFARLLGLIRQGMDRVVCKAPGACACDGPAADQSPVSPARQVTNGVSPIS